MFVSWHFWASALHSDKGLPHEMSTHQSFWLWLIYLITSFNMLGFRMVAKVGMIVTVTSIMGKKDMSDWCIVLLPFVLFEDRSYSKSGIKSNLGVKFNPQWWQSTNEAQITLAGVLLFSRSLYHSPKKTKKGQGKTETLPFCFWSL